MNDTQQNYTGWFLIMLLIVGYVTVNNMIFSKINKQESENNIRTLSESLDEFKMLLEVNQSRLEKKMFDFKRSLHTQCDQTGDGSSRYKNLAKLLLLVTKMKNSLTQGKKFINHISEIKPLILELDDQDIDNAVNELEYLKEIDTLYGIKVSFERIIDTVNYNNSRLFRKIISNWIKVKNKSDPLRVKFAEIEDSILENDLQGIASSASSLTYQEFKPWLNKLNNFVVASQNISIIYNHLLQYIS
ncbi:MAG: hypothetical protein PV340_04850 [Wolbachia sp.]|nr:hypothetical protein [Wolbachia sp.]MDD9336273.1 hypothetical protein [Wolbachia sp.]